VFDHTSAEPSAICCCSCQGEPCAALDNCSRDLGIHIDSDVAMRSHVSRTVSGCFAVLRQHHSIRRSVSDSVFHSLVVSLVMPRRDYTATQHSQGFLRPSSVAFSRCSTLPPDLYIDLLGMSISHRCCKTFTGCSLRNASISSCLCSFTDVCTVWRHGIFSTTSRMSPTPTAAVFGRRHPRSW